MKAPYDPVEHMYTSFLIEVAPVAIVALLCALGLGWCLNVTVLSKVPPTADAAACESAQMPTIMREP